MHRGINEKILDMENIFENIVKNWDRIVLVLWVWSLQVKVDKLEKVIGQDNQDGSLEEIGE